MDGEDAIEERREPALDPALLEGAESPLTLRTDGVPVPVKWPLPNPNASPGVTINALRREGKANGSISRLFNSPSPLAGEGGTLALPSSCKPKGGPAAVQGGT